MFGKQKADPVPTAAPSPPPDPEVRRPDVDVQAVARMEKEVPLPPYYQGGFVDFMKQAQARDPENRHRWVNVNKRNQVLKVWKGWEPCTDREKIKRLGLELLINAVGRAQYMDTELWTMPRALAVRIRSKIAADGAEKSAAQRIALDAMAEDTKGRSKGAVIPFLTSGNSGDCLTREPVAAPAVQEKT